MSVKPYMEANCFISCEANCSSLSLMKISGIPWRAKIGPFEVVSYSLVPQGIVKNNQ